MDQLSPQDREDHKSSQSWMITFTDLVSLMLTFFVLLFSMSNVKLDEWENVIDSLSQSLNPTQEQQVRESTATFNIGTIFRKRAINLEYLASVLEERLVNDPLLRGTRLMMLDDRLVVALPGDLLFEPGRAIMTPGARDAMFALGGIFRNIGNQIGVNGHSDPIPPAGGEYTSNWELSTGRAAAVANALRRAGYEDEIIAFGYSDSRYSELPAVDEAARRAMARRVDVVVFPTVGGR